MIQTIKAVLSDQQGQGLAEYALILALVSIISIAVLTSLGGSISSVFSKVNADLV
jgi:pilus assembly protein Flp/PilA